MCFPVTEACLRPTFLQAPAWHLSWRSQCICDRLVEMDLNYSEPTANLLTRNLRRETDWFHSWCGQSPGHESGCEISLLPSQVVFFAWGRLGLSDLHLQQVPKQSGKERNTPQSICYELDSLRICRFGTINLIQGGSFRKIKQIDQGRTNNKWWSQV